MKQHNLDVLVIGSGCAGLNAADCLYKFGIKKIAVATEGILMGTSRNTGSDKQTYYKPAIASDAADGVSSMAQTLFDCGGMHGDLALTESANAYACFFKLAQLGVAFPQNEFGEFVGYQTDHDTHPRATSAGPLTSKYMTEALEKEVRKNKIPIIDHMAIIKLFQKNNKICGALGFHRKTKEYHVFFCRKIFLATGGCAYFYRDKVYPQSQSGMSGLAIELGAKTANLTEWQYGLASTDFRWNVSGTYQQVIPRYVSVDENGIEHEFLAEVYQNPKDAWSAVFLKGYQWPFDSAKQKGSSFIDICVYNEMQKGRTVYLDYTKNPQGFSFEDLSEEAFNYLKKSDALCDTPIARLEKMNQKAIDLYAQNGINLKSEKLKIAVCAQHQNGGIAVDHNYQTDISGLYVIGEAAGVFGIYRPGGTALNSTQVSALRAARSAAKDLKQEKDTPQDIRSDVDAFLAQIQTVSKPNPKIKEMRAELQKNLSMYAGFIRDPQKIEQLKTYVYKQRDSFFDIIGAVPKTQLFDLFKLRDMLFSIFAFLSALEVWCRDIGYRGGALTKDTLPKNNARQTQILCTKEDSVFWEIPRKIPKSETWFETLYNQNNR